MAEYYFNNQIVKYVTFRSPFLIEKNDSGEPKGPSQMDACDLELCH